MVSQEHRAPALTGHGTHQTGGAGAKHQDGRAHLGGNLVEPVRGTGSRLKESSVDIGEVLDLEDPAGCMRRMDLSRTCHREGKMEAGYSNDPTTHLDKRSTRQNRRSS